MPENPFRCLILACGNTLRSDDGVGPWLAHWAQTRFFANPAVSIISRQQWTPELAEDIARADFVLFIDSSAASEPGKVQLVPVAPSAGGSALATHRIDAPQLLALANELYGLQPRAAFLLTIGAAAISLGEDFSEPVQAALPAACALLETTVHSLLTGKYPAPIGQRP